MSQKHEDLNRALEYGLGIGTNTYIGDLNPKLRFQVTRPSISAVLRHNLKNHFSVLRGNFMLSYFAGDEKYNNNPLSDSRLYKFNSTFFETDFLYEYNFLDFRDFDKVYYTSPYLFGGIGVIAKFDSQVGAYTTLPFGIGIKAALYPSKLNLGFEFGARKIFSDDFDTYNDDQLLSSSSGKDWCLFTNIILTRTEYKQICFDHK